MDASTWGAFAAVAVALTVPWMAFRLALRQDAARWLRERRADLYVDLLTEAHAEQNWLQYAMADKETQALAAAHFTDLRLSPVERARLGARGTIFASKPVNVLFSRLMGEGGRALLSSKRDEGTQIVVRVRIAGIMDDLEKAVRHELGADRIPLDPTTPMDGPAQGTV